MKIYKWQGRGHYLDATMIFLCDSLESAKEMIEKELIDCGLSKSWEESQEIEENNIVYADLSYYKKPV